VAWASVCSERIRANLGASYATLSSMLAVVAFIIAAVSGLALLESASAAPPDDIAVFCRASNPQVMLQVRCFNVEQAAAQRLASTASAADSVLFSRCLGGSQSWTAMEACLAQPPRVPTGTGAAPPVAGDASAPSAPEPGQQAQLEAAAPEPERPTRPISEADAERQLRAVLERVGYPKARCTKKQYGPGWASICE
jgi:hypothetical protein